MDFIFTYLKDAAEHRDSERKKSVNMPELARGIIVSLEDACGKQHSAVEKAGMWRERNS